MNYKQMRRIAPVIDEIVKNEWKRDPEVVRALAEEIAKSHVGREFLKGVPSGKFYTEVSKVASDRRGRVKEALKKRVDWSIQRWRKRIGIPQLRNGTNG